MQQPEYLTITQAAQRLGCTPTTIREWRRRGLITPINEGQRPLYYCEEELQNTRLATRRDKTRLADLRALLDTENPK